MEDWCDRSQSPINNEYREIIIIQHSFTGNKRTQQLHLDVFTIIQHSKETFKLTLSIPINELPLVLLLFLLDCYLLPREVSTFQFCAFFVWLGLCSGPLTDRDN